MAYTKRLIPPTCAHCPKRATVRVYDGNHCPRGCYCRTHGLAEVKRLSLTEQPKTGIRIDDLTVTAEPDGSRTREANRTASARDQQPQPPGAEPGSETGARAEPGPAARPDTEPGTQR